MKNLERLTTDSIVKLDKANALRSLENWRSKFTKDEKPKLVFLNVSGGGLRSSVWTVKALQELETTFETSVMSRAHLITGSSGGMLGASYFRELYRQYKNGVPLDITDRIFADQIGNDVLNPVAYTLAVHDLFFRFRKVAFRGRTYALDRGYAFDLRINENTGGHIG